MVKYLCRLHADEGGRMMKRREFITLVGAAVAWPLAARAQSERVRHIGVLVNLSENDSAGQRFVAAFRQALQEFRLGGWPQCANRDALGRWRSRTLSQICG
jgi:putative tryptophan/tyrosine transport system substrate-binding protein